MAGEPEAPAVLELPALFEAPAVTGVPPDDEVRPALLDVPPVELSPPGELSPPEEPAVPAAAFVVLEESWRELRPQAASRTVAIARARALEATMAGSLPRRAR
jgi:hypothetical protein